MTTAFENIIQPSDLLINYYFTPRKTNARIIRQSGAFIIFGLENHEIKIEKTYHDREAELSYRIIVDGNSKREIIDQLSRFGISKASLHPELYKVAEYIKQYHRIY
ncbi:hypothetical protein RAC89_00325 [Paenibacillus sp. GD4]|uniref:hypothetical protein n=1 Tax=Paenibacillus sp. GD4 TaxID=3068890 RepID=UPI002796DC78|nr:hypothetical protein [Paenibacillus sp. GD4]MDQ1908943.1 hypothetical protein [Paenibacillus sp. GD4]